MKNGRFAQERVVLYAQVRKTYKEGKRMSIKIEKGCAVWNLLCVLSIVGEFPLSSADVLGSPITYRKLFYKLSKLQTYRNAETGEMLSVSLLNYSGRGQQKKVRLNKEAIPILQWLNMQLYYTETFPSNRLSGGELNRIRASRITDALAMLRADIEILPCNMPKLREENRYDSFHGNACFYTAKQIKKSLRKGENKIEFSRIVGALFAGGKLYPVYNTQNSAMKWNGMGELKTKPIFTNLGRINADAYQTDSVILLGRNEKVATQTLFMHGQKSNKTYRFDDIYPNVHYIPLNENGTRMLRLFTVQDFHERILSWLFSPSMRSTGRFDCDAYLDGTYIFSYLDGNLARLTRFYEAATRSDKSFEVICYPFQTQFVKELFHGKINIKEIPLETVEAKLKGKGIL